MNNKIVEKWVAGFWGDKVIVVKWKFRETPKTFIMVVEPDNPVYQDAQTAVRWHSHFRKDDRDQQLFDTWEEALDRLYSKERAAIVQLRGKIDKCNSRMMTLNQFSDGLKETDLPSG